VLDDHHRRQPNKRRRISRKEFAKVLEDEGYVIERTTRFGESTYYINGLSLKPERAKNVKNDVISTSHTLNFYPSEKNNIINIINIEKEPNNPTFINKERLSDKLANILEFEQPTEVIALVLTESGLTMAEAENYIEEAKKQGVIYETKPGYIRKLI
jgi:hypothetical protein